MEYYGEIISFIKIIQKDSKLEDCTFISVLVSAPGSIHVLSFPRIINNGEFYLNVNGGFCAVMSNVHGSRNLFLHLCSAYVVPLMSHNCRD